MFERPKEGFDEEWAFVDCWSCCNTAVALSLAPVSALMIPRSSSWLCLGLFQIDGNNDAM